MDKFVIFQVLGILSGLADSTVPALTSMEGTGQDKLTGGEPVLGEERYKRHVVISGWMHVESSRQFGGVIRLIMASRTCGRMPPIHTQIYFPNPTSLDTDAFPTATAGGTEQFSNRWYNPIRLATRTENEEPRFNRLANINIMIGSCDVTLPKTVSYERELIEARIAMMRIITLFSGAIRTHNKVCRYRCSSFC